MKTIFLIFSIAALSQVSFALFGNYKKMLHEDNLHREPPIIATTSPMNDTIYEGWVKMRLDQFNPTNDSTYYMRYLMNKDHMVDGGPIFIFVGGEWTISPGFIRGGHMYDMARNLSGLILYTEHRYYGFSTPTPDLSMDNLRWLNVDQALADLAHFIVHIKETVPEVRNSGVILVGCSYSGMMVTWFMQKYPHLIQGVWALSAPIEAKVDFYEYKEVVSRAVHDVGGEECSARIQRSYEQMEALYHNGSYSELERIFRLCTPFNGTNILDVWNLFADMSGPWSGIVQYASRYGQQIENACARFLEIEANSDVEAYAQWVYELWEMEEGECYDHTWESFLYWFSGTNWDEWAALSEWRQWLYQTCAEFGFFQTSGSDDMVFGSLFPVEQGYQMCQDLYSSM